MNKKTYRFLAFDLGAESGRAVLGVLSNHKIELKVIHRFRTEGLIMLGTRQWDLARIYEEICNGLRKCAQEYTSDLDGIGVDTWGVDFGLLAEDGTVISNPVHYRDKRTQGIMEYAFSIFPKEEIYKITGIQFLPFNTLYQLISLIRNNSPLLKIADSLLLMGDLFGYLLSGVRSCEYTNASTTQMLDAYNKNWSKTLVEKFNIPSNILQKISPPGNILGGILPEVAHITGISPETPIISPATHDTACAVCAVPVKDTSEPWAYLSSGTWSLLGTELREPKITPDTMEYGFTNEGGVGNKIRFLKNIFGLWLVQECRRIWERQGESFTYEDLTKEAESAKPFKAIIPVNDPRLLAPENMPHTIQRICEELGYPVPQTKGEIVRCALESLALNYRQTLRSLNKILATEIKKLHIVGGGTQNKLLCQMTADACNIPVHAGPVEATVMGNIAVQAMAVGAIKSLEEVREVVSNSTELTTYLPQNTSPWDKWDY
ncbi:MAG: rhamnulokinase [Candidatus Hydrogenedentes bacterium]|nr:rhamnulokinase [Candidatus Hydrogenedentota bacterium]